MSKETTPMARTRQLSLFMISPGFGVPLCTGAVSPSNRAQSNWCATYEEVPFETELLAKPEGAKIEDAK